MDLKGGFSPRNSFKSSLIFLSCFDVNTNDSWSELDIITFFSRIDQGRIFFHYLVFSVFPNACFQEMTQK